MDMESREYSPVLIHKNRRKKIKRILFWKGIKNYTRRQTKNVKVIHMGVKIGMKKYIFSSSRRKS